MWVWATQMVSVFILLVMMLTFFRVADEIAAVLAVGLLFSLKTLGVLLLVLAAAFIVWSLHEIFR